MREECKPENDAIVIATHIRQLANSSRIKEKRQNAVLAVSSLFFVVN